MSSFIWIVLLWFVFSVVFNSRKQSQSHKNTPQHPNTPPIYRPETVMPQQTAPKPEHPYAAPVPPAVSEIMTPPAPSSAGAVTKKKKPRRAEQGSLEGVSLEGVPLEYTLHQTIEAAPQSAVPESVTPSAVFSHDEMVQGLIMSEILGKPKSLRH